MSEIIQGYQKAFEKLLSGLKINRKVLAVFAFGSIINGDIWEESDIDVFVVYKDNFEEMRDIYSEILSVPVHMKVLKKSTFLDSYNNNSDKGMIRNLLVSSKLVISKDKDIEDIYNNAKCTLDKHIELFNLLYLGNLVNDIKVAKKFYQNQRFVTSYEVLIRALSNFSNLYLGINGYTVCKDSLKMVMNLNNTFSDIIIKLLLGSNLKGGIKETIEYIDSYLDVNICIASKFLLDYMQEKEEFLSAYDIKQDEKFKDFNIRIEDILKELSKRDLVLRKSRKIDLPSRERLLNENVYKMRY